MTEEDKQSKGSFFKRLRTGLGKTRSQFAAGVGNLLLGEREIEETSLEDLETALLMTDVGVDATEKIMTALAPRVKRRELNNARALRQALARELKGMLAPLNARFEVRSEDGPFIVFFVGVNGVGKTTTIGKLTKRLKDEGKSVLLAAGDTFRAAAAEQLTSWGQKNGVEVISQPQGSDSASVVYDACVSAKAKGCDVVLADTAGRLQAKTSLMDELAKIKRVVNRLDEKAPHEVILVLDAGVGQNALSQLNEFDALIGVTGLVLTKLDGTAKAGVLFALAQNNPKPVYFIGIGEGVDDLTPFNPDEFVDALLMHEQDGKQE